MKKVLFFICIYFIFFITPLFGETGLVIASPYGLIYDAPYGTEIGKIPFKKSVEIVEVKRLFTRVKYNGLVAYISNSQYINRKSFNFLLKKLKKYGSSHQFCSPLFSRKIPFLNVKDKKIIRYISPGTVLPILEENKFLYKVRFLDSEGYIYKNSVNVFEYDNIESYMKIIPTIRSIKNIKLKISVGKNKVYQFFVAILNYFKIKFKNKNLEEKFQYTKEDLTFKDFKDLLKSLGINSKIYTSLNRYLLIKSEFKKLNLILFKLKIDDNFRYFLLIEINKKYLKFLDIFKLSIKQMELNNFINIFSMSSKILVIYFPKNKL